MLGSLLDSADSAHVHAQGYFVDSFYIGSLLRPSVDARINEASKFVWRKEKEKESFSSQRSWEPNAIRIHLQDSS